jgi:putative SOS response-associated peptidase YedK
MCGHFALHSDPHKAFRFPLAKIQGVEDDWQPSRNIPPTERIVGALKR